MALQRIAVGSGLALLSTAIGTIGEVVIETVTDAIRGAWNWLRSWFHTIPQNVFVEGTPEVGNELYKMLIRRATSQPYVFKHKLRSGHLITGISCVPIDKDIQSPETDVIEGGINYNSVQIRLTPVESGAWGCTVCICGVSDSS